MIRKPKLNCRPNAAAATAEKITRLYKWGGIILWAAVILAAFVVCKDLTVDQLLNWIPKRKGVTAAVLLICFAAKSMTVVVYSGILYGVCGILFPLPMALLVSVIGTIIMATIPYLLGKRLGNGAVQTIVKANPKLEMLQEFQDENEAMVTFFVRMIGIIPGDIAAMYSGARNASFIPFLVGTLLGMSPMILLFCIMGMSADDPSSPAFILSVTIKLCIAAASAIFFSKWKKQKSKT